MEFADEVALKIFEKYDSLGRSGKPVIGSEWTLLAGFLVEKDDAALEVVSLATGTKCVGSKSMCPDGLVINDSHAEVLARRAFLSYLYAEVNKVKQRVESFVFCEASEEDERCIPRDKVKFHFFTSHVPCGDASIIPMECEEKSLAIKRGLKRRHEQIDSSTRKDINAPDIHRTGAKPVSEESHQDPHGEGINYHTKGAVRTKPGRGDPTLSLSCSDKIAKWIFVGVQGALLSQLIQDPVRISTIVIGGGGQFCQKVLEEALIKRSGTILKPKICQSTEIFVHSAVASGDSTKPSATSIIWAKVGPEKVQVSVNGIPLGTTKKNKRKACIQQCKREFFKNFLAIAKSDYSCMTYRSAKDLAEEYQNQCRAFKKSMGAWADSKLSTQLFKITKEELINNCYFQR